MGTINLPCILRSISKNIFVLSISLFVFFSCNNFDNQANRIYPHNEIGKSYEAIKPDTQIIFGKKYIDGIFYYTIAYDYRDKVIVYVINSENIVIDCYFSRYVSYSRVKNMKIGIHSSAVYKRLGEPVFTSYIGTTRPDKYFTYEYLQRNSNSKDPGNKISVIQVGFFV